MLVSILGSCLESISIQHPFIRLLKHCCCGSLFCALQISKIRPLVHPGLPGVGIARDCSIRVVNFGFKVGLRCSKFGVQCKQQ